MIYLSGVLLLVVGALIAAAALVEAQAGQAALRGLRTLAPTAHTLRGRILVGHLAAAPLAGVLLALGLAYRDTAQWLGVTSALGVYIYGGWVVPRKPLVAQRQRQQVLRRLTPGFVSMVRVSKAGMEGNLQLLERYVQRPDARIAPMQTVVGEALALLRTRHASQPFAALRTVARETRCLELMNVTEALAQAEQAGHAVESVLAAYESMLDAILRDEFLRSIRRRQMLLTVITAAALVIGLVGNILFTLAAGSGVLG